MTLTLVDVEKSLVSRTKRALEAAGFAITTDGSNADLKDAIVFALLTLGIQVDDISIPDNDDLARVDSSKYLDVLDLAEYRIMSTLLVNITQTDERLGPHGVWRGQYPTRLLKRFEQLSKSINMKYGVELSELEMGILDLIIKPA